jgi:hypothetical protein
MALSLLDWYFLNIAMALYLGSGTVAERSKACTVFARSEAGIVALSPTQGMAVWYVYAFILCLGSGLATSCSHVQEVLPSVKMIMKLRNQLHAPKWEREDRERERERERERLYLGIIYYLTTLHILIITSRKVVLSLASDIEQKIIHCPIKV